MAVTLTRAQAQALVVGSSGQPEQLALARLIDEIYNAVDPATTVQVLTASGAVLSTTRTLELNHASVVIAATLTVVPSSRLVIKDTSATGTAAHTVTLSGGTIDGTNTVATLNARDEFIVIEFDSAGRGQIVVNVGGVALS